MLTCQVEYGANFEHKYSILVRPWLWLQKRDTLLVGLNSFIFFKWKLVVKRQKFRDDCCFPGLMWWRRRSTQYPLLEGRGLLLFMTPQASSILITTTIHHDDLNADTTIITSVLRSVVVEEGVVTADGLAVDWVSPHCLERDLSPFNLFD